VTKQTDEVVFANFYTTPRASAPLLSDGGGPFGFDIQAALQFDYIVRQYPVSHIFETGCCLGDTTDYLARTYPHISLWTCDVDTGFASFSTERLRRYPHVQVEHGDSAQLLPNVLDNAGMPLLYLDAHWGENWPLVRELKSVRRGIVVVDDFDVGNSRFGFDIYNGVACDIDFIVGARPDIAAVYIGNPGANYDYPCLQVGRRAGRCYLPIDVTADPFEESEMFQRITTKRG
jgi:hypothetical protein